MKLPIFFLLVSTTLAYAGPDDPAPETQRDFNIILHETEYLNSSRLGHDLSQTPADACAKVIAKAKSDGVRDDAEYRFIALGKVLFRDMPARVCVPYERAVHAAEAAQMLATTTDGKQCVSEMDRLLKHGIADVEIEVRDVAFKLGDAKKTICEPIAKGLPISKAEKEKAREVAAAPYKEVGIDGGKLNVCIANGPNIRGAGGVELTPAKIKRASLLFVVTGPVDGVYTLQRLTFKGDEIDAVSEKTFKKAPVAADFK